MALAAARVQSAFPSFDDHAYGNAGMSGDAFLLAPARIHAGTRTTTEQVGRQDMQRCANTRGILIPDPPGILMVVSVAAAVNALHRPVAATEGQQLSGRTLCNRTTTGEMNPAFLDHLIRQIMPRAMKQRDLAAEGEARRFRADFQALNLPRVNMTAGFFGRRLLRGKKHSPAGGAGQDQATRVGCP